MTIVNPKNLTTKQFAEEVMMRDADYITRRNKLLSETVPNINCKSCSKARRQQCKVLNVPKDCLPTFDIKSIKKR